MRNLRKSMESKKVQWLKNSKQYNELKNLILRMELGLELDENEIKTIITMYKVLEDQEDFYELLSKIRVNLFLKYGINSLFFKHVKDEGLFPLLKNYFLENKKESNNKLSYLANEILVDTYTSNGLTYTFDQYKFKKKIQEEGKSINNLIFSAPTSFGKSSAIIDKIKNSLEKKLLIIVPSKLLISQFADDIKIKLNILPVIHHEQIPLSNVYVLTQERAQYLLGSNININFDIIFVDEAHHLVSDEYRSITLNTLIINLIFRNPECEILYFTPFKINLHSNTINKYSHIMKRFNQSESLDYQDKIKIKRFFIEENGIHYIYNETLKELQQIEHKFEYSKKRILYFNKPKDILSFTEEQEVYKYQNLAVDSIRDLLGSGYELFKCIEKGYFPIFGIIPINIRRYFLSEFLKSENAILVVNSAALEGINTNAKSIHIYDYRKGIKNLRPHELENLIGRVNRLSEVVNDQTRLVTDVVFHASKYNDKTKEQVKSYLDNNLLISKINKELVNKSKLQHDEPSNIDEVLIDNQIEEKFPKKNSLNTEVGKLLALSANTEIDLYSSEKQIEHNLLKLEKITVNSADVILNSIVNVFLTGVSFTKEDTNILRLKEEKALNYYIIVLNYYIENISLKSIIIQTVKYWEKRINVGERVDAYVSSFGNIKRNGVKKHWVNINNMSESSRFRYATIKTLIEIEFVENSIFPYLKILHELGKIDLDIYNNIIYSTTNKDEIEIRKLGISNELFDYLKKNNLIFRYDDVDRDYLARIYDNIENLILKSEFKFLFGL